MRKSDELFPRNTIPSLQSPMPQGNEPAAPTRAPNREDKEAAEARRSDARGPLRSDNYNETQNSIIKELKRLGFSLPSLQPAAIVEAIQYGDLKSRQAVQILETLWGKRGTKEWEEKQKKFCLDYGIEPRKFLTWSWEKMRSREVSAAVEHYLCQQFAPTAQPYSKAEEIKKYELKPEIREAKEKQEQYDKSKSYFSQDAANYQALAPDQETLAKRHLDLLNDLENLSKANAAFRAEFEQVKQRNRDGMRFDDEGIFRGVCNLDPITFSKWLKAQQLASSHPLLPIQSLEKQAKEDLPLLYTKEAQERLGDRLHELGEQHRLLKQDYSKLAAVHLDLLDDLKKLEPAYPDLEQLRKKNQEGSRIAEEKAKAFLKNIGAFEISNWRMLRAPDPALLPKVEFKLFKPGKNEIAEEQTRGSTLVNYLQEWQNSEQKGEGELFELKVGLGHWARSLSVEVKTMGDETNLPTMLHFSIVAPFLSLTPSLSQKFDRIWDGIYEQKNYCRANGTHEIYPWDNCKAKIFDAYWWFTVPLICALNNPELIFPRLSALFEEMSAEMLRGKNLPDSLKKQLLFIGKTDGPLKLIDEVSVLAAPVPPSPPATVEHRKGSERPKYKQPEGDSTAQSPPKRSPRPGSR